MAGTTLAHERGTAYPFKEQVVHEIYFDELMADDRAVAALRDPVAADQIVDAYVELGLLRLRNYRTLSQLGRGVEPGPDSSITKLVHSSMTRRLSATALDILGDEAPLWPVGGRRPVGRQLAAPVAVVEGRFHRGRNRRDPAQHRRRAPAGPAQGLTRPVTRESSPKSARVMSIYDWFLYRFGVGLVEAKRSASRRRRACRSILPDSSQGSSCCSAKTATWRGTL